jgi:hypothetical protein
MFIRKITLLFIVNVLLISCVEVYDTRYGFNADVVAVDGFVTNGQGLSVTLRRSRSVGTDYYSQPLRDCTVELKIGSGSVVPLSEFSGGLYVTPNTFQGQVGETYQLRFKTADGKTYESTPERLMPPVPIAKLYYQFNQDGILDRTGTRTAFSSLDVYADFNDPANQKNYYLWRWMDFEEQWICATCEGGKLDSKTKLCVAERNSRITYDYRCENPCWEIYYSNDVNVFADIYTNGRTVTARPVARIPFYVTGAGFGNRAALAEIQQYSITSDAYEYYKLLRDQAQNTGNLTDTPPAAIIGNVRNVNDASEKVVGYFGAAGVSASRIFMDKRPYTGAARYLMLGRDPNLEPDSQPVPPLFEFRPPMAPCVMSANRTPVRPEGWGL